MVNGGLRDGLVVVLETGMGYLSSRVRTKERGGKFVWFYHTTCFFVLILDDEL